MLTLRDNHCLDDHCVEAVCRRLYSLHFVRQDSCEVNNAPILTLSENHSPDDQYVDDHCRR